MKTILSILIIVLLLLGVGYFFTRGDSDEQAYQTPNQSSNEDGTGQAPATSTENPPITTSMVKVFEPLPNALVKSPLTVSGEARGNWYFEASFPVKVLDANGKVLGITPAQAQGEWMTTNFVPFKVVISFATSTTATGTLVLEKDNPSGLPEHAAEVRVPIRFR